MDPAFLLDMVGGDRAVAREILDDFVRSDVEDREKLAEAVHAGVLPDVHTFAHRIKGAARSIGADSYAALAECVENGASAGTLLTAEAAQVDEAGAALAEWASRFA